MDNEERNKKLIEYLDKKVREIDGYYPKLNVKAKADRASARVLASPGTFDEVKEKLDKTLDKLIADYEEKCLEMEQDVMAARDKFDGEMTKHDIESGNLNFFGETFEFILIEVFKLYEEIVNDNTIKDEDKYFKFTERYSEMLNMLRQKVKTFLACQFRNAIAIGEYQGRKEDPLLYVVTELFRGYDSLNYSTVANLYKIFKDDLTIVGTEFASNMYSTIRVNEPIYYSSDYKYISNSLVFNFEYLDIVFAYAKEHGKELKFNNFLCPLIVPENLEESVKKIPSEYRKSFILDFIEDYVINIRKYLDSHGYKLRQFEAIKDIANNSSDGGNCETTSFWSKYVGEDYYIDILRIVKKYLDNVEVMYSDYNEYLEYKAKHICGIVNSIRSVEKREDIVLLNSLGLESHFDEFIEELGRELRITDLYESMPLYASLNIPLYRTEYNYRLMDIEDVTIKDNFIDTMLYVDGKCGIRGLMAIGNSDFLISNLGEDNETSFVNYCGEPKREYNLLCDRYTGRVLLSSLTEPEVLIFTDEKVSKPEKEVPRNVIRYSNRDDKGFATTLFLIVLAIILFFVLALSTYFVIFY